MGAVVFDGWTELGRRRNRMSKRVRDRGIAGAVRRRREYLLSKGASVTMGIVGSVLLLCFGCITLLCVPMLIAKLVGVKDMGNEPLGADLLMTAVYAGLAYLGGAMLAGANNRIVD